MDRNLSFGFIAHVHKNVFFVNRNNPAGNNLAFLKPLETLLVHIHQVFHAAAGIFFRLRQSIRVGNGGLGSLRGAFVAALLLGIVDTAGKYLWPQSGAFIIYLVTLAVLLIRPYGLFGKAPA